MSIMQLMGNYMPWFGQTTGGGIANPLAGKGQLASGIGRTIAPYYQPYVQAGTTSLPTLQEQINQLVTNPAEKYTGFGQTYHQSPGYQFSLGQAMNAANQAAAAGGMAGSPMHQQQSAQMAQGLSDQDYYNYLNQMMGLYGQGMSGLTGLTQLGYGASNELAQNLANAMMSQANLDYAKQQQQRSSLGNLLGAGVGLLGSFLF